LCLTCGCNQPTNDHGDAKNLTRSRFADAGRTKAAGGKSVGSVVATVVKTNRKRK
jgi:hypothetical protein